MKNNLKPWSLKDKENWQKEQSVKRSYREEVLSKVQALSEEFELSKYGALSCDRERYPLYLVTSKEFHPARPNILVTGGVHGYETSGVHGALAFFDREAKLYEKRFNFVCAPCISPWGYETINRWNSEAMDPNRNFFNGSPVEECALVMQAIGSLEIEFLAHFDLHETTDTDNTVFRPALEKRDGVALEVWDIPDGFYLVGDSENPCPDFQRAVIESVKKVTHIAPCDGDQKIIGEPIEQNGVINYHLKKLSLCAGFSNAKYATTTEVYPDSPRVDAKNCVDAQVAAINGGLDFLGESKDAK